MGETPVSEKIVMVLSQVFQLTCIIESYLRSETASFCSSRHLCNWVHQRCRPCSSSKVAPEMQYKKWSETGILFGPTIYKTLTVFLEYSYPSGLASGKM